VKPVGLKLHFFLEGIIALGVAVFHLIILRGLDVGALLLFGVPPLLAFTFLQSTTAAPRRIALAFLLLVGVGACIAPLPAIFPKLGGFDPRLPIEANRLLAWYAAVYLLFIFGVVPTWLFVSSLYNHRTGRPAQFSRFTCYIGLFTVALMLPGIVVVLNKHMGFWPII
jgi:hypothetical protein